MASYTTIIGRKASSLADTKNGFFYASSFGGLFGISVKDDRRLAIFSCVTIGLMRLFTDDILLMFDDFSYYIGMPTPITTEFIGTLHNCFVIGALTIIIASFGLLHIENSIVIRRLEKEINEKNKIELELQRTTENAVKLAQAKAKYLTTMSHEIRTPLSGILGLTNQLLDTNITDAQAELINTIQQCGEFLLVIINDVLDLEKMEQGKMRLDRVRVNLDESMDMVFKLIQKPAAEKHIELKYERDTDCPKLCTSDPVRTVQILLNLCQNAVKFTKDGTVSVSISQISHKEVTALKEQHRSKRHAPATLQDLLMEHEISSEAKDSPKYTAEEENHLRRKFYYHFVVKDTGIGIPQDRIDLLFKEFVQADVSTTRKYGGTGLGLAICQRLCEMMEGCIWVESQQNQGSQFHFIVGAEPAEHGNRSGSLGQLGPNVNIYAKNPNLAEGKFRALVNSRNGSSTGLPVREVNLGLKAPPPASAKLQRKPSDTEIVPGTTNPELQNVKVLLVEDNQVNQRVVLYFLQKMGLSNVDTACDGSSAIEKATKNQYHVIFMDIWLPDMDGFEVTRKIRDHHQANKSPEPYVVALTASNNAEEGKQERIQVGMKDFIPKPAKRGHFEAAFERYFQWSKERPQN
eukprot:TRINITY_DN3244_c0_g1_i2.p1 TRINITY_DN3244_c0_g1~~TRINITY_DN3244_c0_g1_i2.p1  ORF type:complete len:633 (-),score=59.81 TRINITY_DN3244_c0_g1_i2:46-1944(-)